MRTSEAVASILADKGRSKRSLALELGISPPALELGISPPALEHRLSASPRIDTVAGMMAALGYDVVAVPSGTDVEGSFRLDS